MKRLDNVEDGKMNMHVTIESQAKNSQPTPDQKIPTYTLKINREKDWRWYNFYVCRRSESAVSTPIVEEFMPVICRRFADGFKLKNEIIRNNRDAYKMTFGSAEAPDKSYIIYFDHRSVNEDLIEGDPVAVRAKDGPVSVFEYHPGKPIAGKILGIAVERLIPWPDGP